MRPALARPGYISGGIGVWASEKNYLVSLEETPASPVIMIETLHWAELGERQFLAMRSRRSNGSGLAWTQRMRAGEGVRKNETPSTAGSRPRLNERKRP